MEDHSIILESSLGEEIGSIKDQNLIGSTKGKMGEVREENGRLKFLLANFVKDYQSLQTNFIETLHQQDKPIIHHQEATKVEGTSSISTLEECDELVLLSLGMSSSSSKDHPTKDEKKINSNNRIEEKREDCDEGLDNKGLALGLDNIRFDPSPQGDEATNDPNSPESSFVEKGKEEGPTEMWPPSKVLKTMKAADKSGASNQQNQHKKARVSIRARCDTQTMNDGCQWRKYGQKIAKGNPCPRAYYRCTVSPSCPVRKQVQRCADDMSILITTYEGTHNHPLPITATAMASTTCAAASMLQSPSLTSSQQLGLVANSHIAAPSIINSFTCYNSNNASNFSTTCQMLSPHQFHFPNYSSIISTSNYNSHPTITLDLTSPPAPSHSGDFTSSGFSYKTPKFSSTNFLNFSSTLSNHPLQSVTPPSNSPWSANHSGYFNSAGTLPQNRSQGVYIINSGSQPFYQGKLHQPIHMMGSNNTINSQQPLSDTIAAATKAITANPKFQSALATALTTYVGNGGVIGGGSRLSENHVAAESAPLMNLKLSSCDMSYTTTGSKNGMGSCASSGFLNMSSSNGNLIMFPPPPPLPVSKGSPGSSSNHRSDKFMDQ